MFGAFDFREAWGCWLFSQDVYCGDIVSLSEKRGSGNITLSVDRLPSTDDCAFYHLIFSSKLVRRLTVDRCRFAISSSDRDGADDGCFVCCWMIVLRISYFVLFNFYNLISGAETSVDCRLLTDVGSQFPRQTGTVQTMAALTVVG